MEAIVVKAYIDKFTNVGYNTGDKVEYGVDRAKVLSENGYIKLTTTIETATPKVDIEIKATPKKDEPKKAVAKNTKTKKKQG